VQPILAHGAGINGLPLPRWLLAYLLAFLVLLTVLTLRATSPRPRWRSRTERAAADDRTPIRLLGSVVGLALLLTTFLAGALSHDDAGLFAYTAAVVAFWFGGQALAAVIGDWYSYLDPFVVLTQPIPDRDRDGPWWTAPAMLFSFLWFWLVFGERAPRNRETATFLALYTVAVLVGAAVWGRSWVRRGEGFAAIFALLGELSPFGKIPLRGLVERATMPGACALLSVYVGGVAFDGLTATSWWLDVMGTRTGWSLRGINTIGLLWTTAVVAVALLAAARAVARLAGAPVEGLADRLAMTMIPLALGCWIAHELPTFLIDIQNFISLASDPFSQGWDIFGTIDWLPRYTLLTPMQEGWIETLAVAVGATGTGVLAHELIFGTFPPRVAVRAVWPVTMTAMVGVVGATLLLLGT
jgi:hypothetical protein